MQQASAGCSALMPRQPRPKMHVQVDSSQVRSARISCAGIVGVGKRQPFAGAGGRQRGHVRDRTWPNKRRAALPEARSQRSPAYADSLVRLGVLGRRLQHRPSARRRRPSGCGPAARRERQNRARAGGAPARRRHAGAGRRGPALRDGRERPGGGRRARRRGAARLRDLGGARRRRQRRGARRGAPRVPASICRCSAETTRPS